MSEEEKEAILNLRLYSSNTVFSKYDETTCLLRARDVQILLNLVGKQQKEIDKKEHEIKELKKQLIALTYKSSVKGSR